jgi:hypothetical protein
MFVCVTPVDMRKQAASLALIVEQTLKRGYLMSLQFRSSSSSTRSPKPSRVATPDIFCAMRADSTRARITQPDSQTTDPPV